MVVLLGVLTGCSSAPARPTTASTASTATTASAATPADVVRAYLNALQTKNCAAAKALITGEHQSWCPSVNVSNATVTGTTPDGPGGPSGAYHQSAHVSVHLNVSGGDGSLTPGPMDWGYILVRNADSEAWRIIDEGMG